MERSPHTVFMPAHARRRAQRPARIGLHVTAMIDVVFLLLVYFMVATEFRLGEEVYRLDLPERRPAARALDPFDLDEEPLRVFVATTGLGFNTYSLRLEGPYEQPASFEALHDFLRNRQISDVTGSGLFEPDHPIVVLPTRTTRWQHVVETFNAAARARYTNITFASAP